MDAEQLPFRLAVRPALIAYTAPLSMWAALEETDMAKWQDVVGAVAPALASALGGPLAGIAVKAIAGKVLGKPDATEQEVAQAILGMPPEALVKLKEAELELQKHLADSGVKLEDIHQRDRDSARKREADVRDFVPGLLAALVVSGFGWTVYTLLAGATPPAESREVLYMMLGALSSALAQVLAYYFGSSSGSKEKTSALERVARG